MQETTSRLEALEETARQAKQLKFSFKLDTKPGYTEVNAETKSKGATWDVSVRAKRHEPGRSQSVSLRALSLRKRLMELGEKLPGAQIMWDSLDVSSSKSPLQGQPLKELVIAALREAFPSSPHSSVGNVAEGPLDLLRRGAEALAEWNALTDAERGAVPSYRKLELSNLDLDRFRLGSLDFEGSNFSGSTLRRAELAEANLNHCRLVGCNLAESFCFHSRFHSANLQGAIFAGAVLREAKLRLANLESVDFSGADLRGADFSGANLTGAILEGVITGPYTIVKTGTRYDARTKFPEGYTPGVGWATEPDEA